MKIVIIMMLVASMLTSTNSEAQLEILKGNSMDRHTVSEFKVVGIEARIANVGDSAGKEVEAIWGRFWGEDIRNKIPNSLNEDIYAIYTNYESDFKGAYTLIIGLAVESFDDIPDGFTSIEIKRDTYKKYISKGKMPEAVLKTWFEIWGDTELKRAYRTDFTVHGEKYFDGDNAEVETFISIQE